MGEIFVMAIIGSILGGFIFGIGYGIDYKVKAAEKEEKAQRLAENKRKLAPRLIVEVYRDPPELQPPYKLPQARYKLLIQNLNDESVPIQDLRIEFNFRQIVVEEKHEIWVHNPDPIGGLEVREHHKDGTTSVYKETKTTGLEEKFVFKIRQVNVNKEQWNLNFIDFFVENWSDQAAFAADVILDTSKLPHIIRNPGEAGSFKGKYSYEVDNVRYSENVRGQIYEDPKQVPKRT